MAYNVNMKKKENIITQVDYTLYEPGYQLKLPFATDILIPNDDPVRLLNAIVERMDISEIMHSYSRYGRIEYSPRTLLKILLYGYVRNIYSSRKLEQACRENINFMYLLEDHPAPDHNTINRFRSKYLLGHETGLLEQMTAMLMEWGFVSMESVFIDGTKIEANANRYTFVWKSRVLKNKEKLEEKIRSEVPGIVEELSVKWWIPETVKVHHLKKLRKKLYAQAEAADLVFVHGKGCRKAPLQRAIETVEDWIERLKKYTKDLHICGDRNSYCKTDHNATFMHMKEDHMLNGQLKPGYNVNVATSEEFIIGNYISADRNDVHTMIPFMKKLKKYPIENVVVDSGYESEENYCYFETLKHIELYVKPANHEQKKKRKYRTDISRRENMGYDPAKDCYICAQGKELTADFVKNTESKTGLAIETTVYSCKECNGCPLKEKCIKAGRSKKPLSERNKVLYVSKRFQAQREEMEAKITSEKGVLLRVNRSIQAEGAFAMIKEDMNFRRFMLRSTVKVEVEWTILSMAYNILKLHHKIKKRRLGTGLVIPKGFPAGL